MAHMRLLPTSTAVKCLVLLSTLATAREINAGEFRGKLSSLPSFRDELGAGWNHSPGLVIDDISDLSNFDAPTRAIAQEIVKQFAPLGVVSVADFSYTRKDIPRIVTVRIFVFKDADAAKSWWKTKYQHVGWEKYYQKIDGFGEAAVKGTGAEKVAALEGNVWLTSHQLHNGDEYRRAMKHYLKHVAVDQQPGESR